MSSIIYTNVLCYYIDYKLAEESGVARAIKKLRKKISNKKIHFLVQINMREELYYKESDKDTYFSV